MMDDLISRQAAIDAIEHRLAEPAYQHEGEDWYTGMNCAESELYDLPSAQPERKMGKWIVLDECSNEGVYCSECHKKVLKIDYSNTMKCKNFKFCPNCGADMRGEQDE